MDWLKLKPESKILIFASFVFPESLSFEKNLYIPTREKRNSKDEKAIYVYCRFFSPSVIKKSTMPVDDMKESSTGRNLYSVIRNELNAETMNKIKSEFRESPELLKNVSRTIKNNIVGAINLKYFEICIYVLKLDNRVEK